MELGGGAEGRETGERRDQDRTVSPECGCRDPDQIPSRCDAVLVKIAADVRLGLRGQGQGQSTHINPEEQL